MLWDDSEQAFDPEPPVLHTSDGEALEFHELMFDEDQRL